MPQRVASRWRRPGPTSCRTRVAAALSERRIIGLSSARWRSLSGRSRTPGRCSSATSSIALSTEADGTGRSSRRPHAPHAVRTAKATSPRRVRAKASAASTPGCQRAGAAARAGTGAGGDGAPGPPASASTVVVASAPSIARLSAQKPVVRHCVRYRIRVYVMTDSTLSAPATFDAQAAAYEAPRRRLIPPFDAFYGTAVAALELLGRPPRRVLDLGAGTGMLAARVAAAYPDAELVLTDGAPAMLEQARAALGDRAQLHRADLADPPPDGPFDAVLSALAIHHLDDAGKQALFARVRAALPRGGVL